MSFPRSCVSLFFGALITFCLGTGAASAIVLPTGFYTENVAPSATFDTPVQVVFMPDTTAGVKRMLVVEKRGVLWQVVNGVKSATPLWDGQVEVLNNADRGLLSVAVDPDFETNHYLYLLYTVDPDSDSVESNDEAWGRLTRYQVSANDLNSLIPSSRTILFGTSWADGPLSASPSHTIGTVRFGRDKTLLVTMGDGANFDRIDFGGLDPNAFLPGRVPADQDLGAYRSQYINSLCGKVLRLDPATGHGLPSNPYWDGDPSSVRSRVWAYGLRNPYRFTVRPNTGSMIPADGRPGQLFIGEVGWYQVEEVNVVVNGGENFGWPCFEGFGPTDQYASLPQASRWLCDSIGTVNNPATSYAFPQVAMHHSTSSLSTPPGFTGNASIGGAFYQGSLYPAKYRDRYFAVDFGQSWMNTMRVDSLGVRQDFQDFSTGMQGPVNLETEPGTGDLVYISIYGNQVLRIRYNGEVPTGNVPPVVVANATPDLGVAPLSVSFSGAGTFDDNGDPLTYSWDFGDGSGSPTVSANHTYTIAGDYAAVLTVDDGQGGVGRDTARVSVALTTDFPSTGILDNFDRANGPIGSAWGGDTSGMVVFDSALVQQNGYNSFVLLSPVLSPVQEVYVTIKRTTANAPENDLMLKIQGATWDAGHIEVRYDDAEQGVRVSTYSLGTGWAPHSGLIPMVLQNGDQFGARAFANGLVVVYRNHVQMGIADCSDWPQAALGGRVGLTLGGVSNSIFDDFGGGNATLNVNTPPTVQISLPDTSWAVAGDTLHFACVASDGQQPDSTLDYRWDVDLHHNTHVHPSAYVSNVRTGEYLVADHDDGTGVNFLVRVRVTDNSNATASDTVRVFPEIDLTPRNVTLQPSVPSNVVPVTIGAWLHDLGRMPAHRSRWRMLLDGAVVAEGDTVVNRQDSLFVSTTVAPLATGAHAVRVVTDTLGAVVETNEANNAVMFSFSVVSPTAGVDDLPMVLALSSAYPNPTASAVAFALALPTGTDVSLAILDLQGRTIWSNGTRMYGAGRHSLVWPGRLSDGRRAAAGMYLAHVRVGRESFTRRFVRLH